MILENEARFTRPRKECPNPEYWHSTDSDSTEVEVSELVGTMVRALQPEYVIETGTAFGQTAFYIGEALKQNRHGRCVSLEVDTARIKSARDRCLNLPVDIREMSSLSFVPEQSIDFGWFDSLVELRPLEIQQFAPYFSSRAVIGVHDTGPQHGTKKLLESLIESGLIVNPLFLPTPRGVMFARIGQG